VVGFHGVRVARANLKPSAVIERCGRQGVEERVKGPLPFKR
jgi:hypothetical protein